MLTYRSLNIGKQLLIKKKDLVQSRLDLFLHAAVTNGNDQLVEYLTGKGADINSTCVSIYQGNTPLFTVTKIRNMNKEKHLLINYFEDKLNSYNLDLIPLYVSGDDTCSAIINAIVNNVTYSDNLLTENKNNAEVLADKTNKFIKLISDYVENIDNKEELEVQQLIVIESKSNSTYNYSECNFPQNYILNFDIKGQEFHYPLDVLFKNYESVAYMLDIAYLGVLEIIHNCHKFSNYKFWSNKLKAVQGDLKIINEIDFPQYELKPEGLLIVFNPFTIGEVCTVTENCTLLHIAANEGNEQNCKMLLNKGANINPITVTNRTPLHFAVLKGHAKIVHHLLERAVDVNCKDVDNITPLHCAAINGNEEICQALLHKGSNVNATTIFYNTPLHFAIWNGHEKIVKLFLEHEADFNLEDTAGTSALHFAAYRGNKDIVEMLLIQGVDVNVITKYHNTPLHFAAWKGHEKICKCLVKCGADITHKDRHGVTALHLAAFIGNEGICLDLLNKGADVNAPTEYQITPLHFAAYRGHEKTVKLLCEYCLNINIGDNTDKTALHFAALQNNVNTVRVLLECGANVDAQDFDCITALHIAAKEGFSKTVQLLLSKGADINITLKHDPSSIKCFHLLVEYSTHWLNIFYFHILCSFDFQAMYFFHVAEFYFAKVRNYCKTVELFLSNGVDVNIKQMYGYTYICLLTMSASNYFRRVEHFEQAVYTNYPFMIIMRNIIMNIYKVLLNYGATLDSVDVYGSSVLNFIETGCIDIFDLLLEFGADVNARLTLGVKPFQVTIYHLFNIKFTIKHLSRIAAASTLNEYNSALLRIYKTEHSKCIKEIETMKTDLICRNISVYDILTKPINRFSVFEKKVNLVHSLNSKDMYRYPIYAKTLKRRAELGEENKNLREYLINLGCVQTLEVSFPTLVANKILNFFNILDLLYFVKAVHGSPNCISFKWYERHKNA